MSNVKHQVQAGGDESGPGGRHRPAQAAAIPPPPLPLSDNPPGECLDLVGVRRRPTDLVLQAQPARLRRLHRLEHSEQTDFGDELAAEGLIGAQAAQHDGAALIAGVMVAQPQREQVLQVLVHHSTSFCRQARSSWLAR